MIAEIHIYQAERKDLDKAANLFNQYRQFYKREDDLNGAKSLTLSTQLHNVTARQVYESAGYEQDEEFAYYHLNLS